jgi:galactokinase
MDKTGGEDGVGEHERSPDPSTRALEAGRAAFGSGWQPDLVAVAPGRLELLGNHIDYNGGPVLAAAIDRSVVALVASGGAAAGVQVVMADLADREPVTLEPSALVDWRNPAPPPSPHDYARGVVAAAMARPEVRLRTPARVAVAGDVPIGFGLSSSAALCVALTLALHEPRPDDRELVLRAQEAEHRAGTPCGTMDQSASVGGGVIRYDGTTLAIERVDPDLGDLVFAVADSGVHRSLGASSYPLRVAESQEALAIARRYLVNDVPNLAAIDGSGLDLLTNLDRSILSPLLLRRVRHVVTETTRVRQGIVAMSEGDWEAFGALMTASGRSSATDYDISHPLVEEVVAEALAVEGVLGARMMGGGEGGTALILLPRSVVPALRDRLGRGYYDRRPTGAESTPVHIFAFAPGAHLDRFV